MSGRKASMPNSAKNYPFPGAREKHPALFRQDVRYEGVKAAIVDYYHFESALTPSKLRACARMEPLPQLESMGMHLDMQISGNGQGRIPAAFG